MGSLDKNFKRNMAIFNRNVLSGVKGTILIATKKVETSAKIRIQHGAKSGVTRKLYNPRRTHTASAAGESPATDLGTLVQSINGFVDTNGLSGGVEATAPHAEPLELGTRNMDARPFLTPALEENRKGIRKDMIKALKKASKF